MEGALESKKRAALLAVSPICALIPAAILVLVAILQPWWTTRQDITYYPSNVSSFTVTQRSEISLWGHHGCRLNETWADICSLPEEDCIPPPAPPKGYVPPWTPPPLEEDNTQWRIPVVTGPPNVRITTSMEDRPFRCVSGNCGGPGVTTTPPPSNYQPPASAGLGDVAFGDAQARVGDEVVSSNEDSFRIPPTPVPPPATTAPPTFAPEVGEVNPSVLATNPPSTTWAPSGPFAGLWQQTGSGSQSSNVDDLYVEKQAPDLADTGGGSFPGAKLAVEKCPPYEQQYWDPLSPPAGQFICSLKATCGTMSPILGFLFVAEGLLCLNVVALVAVGIGGGGLDVFATYANVVIMPFSLVSLIIALVLAGSNGLSPPVHEMVSVGAICAIVAVLLVSLALVVACLGLFSHFAISNLLSKAEAAARVAAEHAQATLEATEEWRLQQDAENAKKKPEPLGWRSKKVHPETTLGLEDARSNLSKAPTDDLGSVLESAPGPDTPRRNSALKVSVLALADMPTQPEVTSTALAEHVSLPVRSIDEATPSPATEQCMRSFVQSPEGAVYAQRFGQSAPPTAREVDEWVPKMSRSSGMTYYVNVETGETRWTPPVTNPQEAWSGQEGQEAAAQAPEWKKKRLKNGTVISVRA